MDELLNLKTEYGWITKKLVLLCSMDGLLNLKIEYSKKHEILLCTSLNQCSLQMRLGALQITLYTCLNHHGIEPRYTNCRDTQRVGSS